MPDPDHDAEPEPTTDPRFDAWPVRHYDAYDDLTVERATPAEEESVEMDDVEWVGAAGPAGTGGTYFYEPARETLHEGQYDPENDRVVIGDEDEGRRLEADETLGDHLVDIGEDHDWGWLSSFARDHMDTGENGAEDPVASHLLPPGFDRRDTEFQRRNLADSDDADVAFFGSHTFDDEDGRVHVLEREFDVTADGDGSGAAVDVEERYLLAEAPREERRAGDADLVDEGAYELALDVDPDEPTWDGEAERLLGEWHRRHLAPPELDEHRRVDRSTYDPAADD
ncbi:MAG: hypothetical protein ABEJ26_08735 [Halosimplex sp.]